ncbi:hypothetical protein IWW34DRAFT_640196 [Fusarium oxysporum f. sp. albedinis]|nr:hypothetical protein IWW34DRAFT_640248 [Fusarium oxysporum f. sp. albedinis]KAI3571000.1 hypothetical protein IWW34DRAFT_640196 [Fusarium oxysporum f. sp. albedinis]
MDPTQRQSAPKFARIPCRRMASVPIGKLIRRCHLVNGAYVDTTKYIIEPAALPAHQIKTIFKAIEPFSNGALDVQAADQFSQRSYDASSCAGCLQILPGVGQIIQLWRNQVLLRWDVAT